MTLLFLFIFLFTLPFTSLSANDTSLTAPCPSTSPSSPSLAVAPGPPPTTPQLVASSSAKPSASSSPTTSAAAASSSHPSIRRSHAGKASSPTSTPLTPPSIFAPPVASKPVPSLRAALMSPQDNNSKPWFLNHCSKMFNQTVTNPLRTTPPCALCTSSLSSLPSLGTSIGNLSDCTGYPSIYAAAFSNQFGPSDPGTAKCLFSLEFSSGGSSGGIKKVVIVVVSIVCVLVLFLIIVGFWAYWKLKMTRDKDVNTAEMSLVSGLDSMDQSTTLIRFTIDDVKQVTKNFSRDNIIGRGGYGNVYRGVLSDGSEVALKRFKNCSAAGDAIFTHEVQVIASVRHVNLVALRGYCSATSHLEGYQRIIVTDLMKNGSLHDHLFGSMGTKLSWPIRQQIALGTARGLAYLHYGAQPSIIHRDIKASNILLDEKFEAKVADFGLAKFNPEGMTHMSTRVAGTMGYVAPEYALYGQLTERSDVFSFGVVLLELLSGRKALQMNNDGQPSALTDWAWLLVRTGKTLDVIEDGMPEPGSPQVLEKYVLIAVFCSHPQLYARPTMDQVVKMMETDESVPSIPERSIPLIAARLDIERSVSSSGSGQLSSPTGYQPYTLESDRHSSNSKEEGSSGSRILSTDNLSSTS